MRKIEVEVINPYSVIEAERLMVTAARLTQRGHKIKNMKDFFTLLDQPYSEATVRNMTALPHPTIQKFGQITVAVVGASRRFLAQITRHQNEVKFMSASLQYSDYSGEADFVVPYDMLDTIQSAAYLTKCAEAMQEYKKLIDYGIGNDSAGYIAPQGLRNILIISATPYQWKHMIGQRTCRRNTSETRYVMLKIWEQLYKLSPSLFSPDTTGPFCTRGGCKEGKMACGRPIGTSMTPYDILVTDFSKLYEEAQS